VCVGLCHRCPILERRRKGRENQPDRTESHRVVPQAMHRAAFQKKKPRWWARLACWQKKRMKNELALEVGAIQWVLGEGDLQGGEIVKDLFIRGLPGFDDFHVAEPEG